MKVWKKIIVTINKMKNKKNITVRTIPKLNYKIVGRGKFDTLVYDHSLSGLVTGTSIKSGGVKLVLSSNLPS